MNSRDKPTHRYKPGWASLAYEVLREARNHGISGTELSKSAWAEFLLWHKKSMLSGREWPIFVADIVVESEDEI